MIYARGGLGQDQFTFNGIQDVNRLMAIQGQYGYQRGFFDTQTQSYYFLADDIENVYYQP